MENLKKKIIFEDRWTFKSFIRILESCQKQNSSLRRYEIIMELLSLLDPIWKIQKNKNHEKHDDGKNYARKFWKILRLDQYQIILKIKLTITI